MRINSSIERERHPLRTVFYICTALGSLAACTSETEPVVPTEPTAATAEIPDFCEPLGNLILALGNGSDASSEIDELDEELKNSATEPPERLKNTIDRIVSTNQITPGDSESLQVEFARNCGLIRGPVPDVTSSH